MLILTGHVARQIFHLCAPLPEFVYTEPLSGVGKAYVSSWSRVYYARHCQLKHIHFMINDLFRLGCACYKQTRDVFQPSLLTGVRLWAVITLQTLW